LYRLTDQKRGTLNGTQTAITAGTFEQQWGLDGTGNWKTFKQDDDGNGTWELNQTRTANKGNEITNITNSVGTVWATPAYDTAGNMTGMPNPPVTITGSTPAWVPMTEAQWNTLTEAEWSAMTENTTSQPQRLSASYDAWNRLVLITNGTQKVSEHGYDARVIKSPPTYPPTNARNLHPGNALSKLGKRRNPGFSGVSVSIRNAKGYLYELRNRRLMVRAHSSAII